MASNISRTRKTVPFFMTALILAGTAFVLLPAPAAAQSTTSINIVDYSFSPGSIVVVIGVNNTVTWTNTGSHTHTVTADDNSFNSGDLAPGKMFTQTLTTPGTIKYHCNIHSSMHGTVVVKGPLSSTTTASQSTTAGTSGGGVPEFPFAAAGVTVITALVLVSYLLTRRSMGRGTAR